MPPTGTASIEFAQSEQELVDKNSRSHKGWMLLGGISLLILGGVILVTVLMSTPPIPRYPPARPGLGLDDFLSGRLNPERFNATWISDTELLYRLGSSLDDTDDGKHQDDSLEAEDPEEGDVYVFDVETRTRHLLVHGNASPAMQTSFLHEISPDRKYLLIGSNYRKVYRHSFIAHYTIRALEAQSSGPQERPLGVIGDDRPEVASWGSRGSQLAFVLNGDLYYKASAVTPPLRLTSTGRPGLIYNGAPDWVYEEEIFASNKAFWFSPGGNFLAYANFNDTNVRSVDIPYYGPAGHPETQYPVHHIVRYPKCGTNNPVVSLFIADFRDLLPKFLQILPPPAVGNFFKPLSEPVLATVTWLNEDHLIVVWMNRVQNLALIELCHVPDRSATNVTFAECRTIHREESKTGWVDLFTAPIVNKNGTQFAFIASFEQDEDTGAFRHIAVVDAATGQVKARTHGIYTVIEILNWSSNDEIFYEGTSPTDPGVKHIYRVNSDGVSTCFSCTALPEDLRGQHHSAEVSKDGSYVSLTTSGPKPLRVDILSKTGDHIALWEGNKKLNRFLNEHRVGTYERMRLEIPGTNFTAQIALNLPPNIDKSGSTKYPVVVSVYAGPDTTQVSEKWSAEWGAYLASNRSMVYVSIDGRGSGLKGDAVAHDNYRHLGTDEIYDQINVTRQLLHTLPYLDKKRVAIWGWSYGGYATLAALSYDVYHVFKCGMAVAPVTDWALYDSIYTERYMGLPTVNDNAKGYYEAALTSPERIESFKNKKMLIVHGSFDDNVHYQQSMRFSRSLELNDIAFEEMSYADEDHSLSSVRPHLFHTLERFLDDCMMKKS